MSLGKQLLVAGAALIAIRALSGFALSPAMAAEQPDTVMIAALAAPSAAATYPAGEPLKVQADAMTEDGQPSKVTLTVDGASNSMKFVHGGSVSSTFTPTKPGTYVVTAKVEHLDGEQTALETKVITVA